MTFQRKTLRTEVALDGFGLHSGVPVTVRFVPAETGIRFLFGGESIEARPENVLDTTRCTRLGSISTIEHAMAAIAGLEITDIDVVLNAPELPAMDGSAEPFRSAMSRAGIADLGDTEIPDLFSRVFLQEPGGKIAISSGSGHWRYEFSTEGGWPRFQAFETSDIVAGFGSEIAPARTFGFEKEIPAIRAAGLAQGLDFEKALVIGEEGYINTPRFEDEPARHKLLDAMGDIALAGVPVRFLNVVAERSGHRMNVEIARRLRIAVFGE
ncbi:MAG TPA: UDP-3-O-acyl-N-acetylglucosamine deacetylase [Fimbriimonadaceae bacterium]|nr:UDP-3-O-acyl-N-acetylglucosamine deacetylase [Fimbriimonadaceae bacterium]